MKKITLAIVIASLLAASCRRYYPHEKLMRHYQDSVSFWYKRSKTIFDSCQSDTNKPSFKAAYGNFTRFKDSLDKYGPLAVSEFVQAKK